MPSELNFLGYIQYSYDNCIFKTAIPTCLAYFENIIDFGRNFKKFSFALTQHLNVSNQQI